MPSPAGWLSQLPPRLRAVRGGLHPASALKITLGRHDDVRIRGVRLTGPDARSVANTAVEVAAGEYAAPGFAIAPCERVIDGGANVGAFAVLAARAGASVVAYEPHPFTFRHLEQNVDGLGVSCRRAALVSDRDGGTVRLSAAEEADTHHRVSDGSEAIEVPAVPLAKAVGERCDLLKLDIEGSEFDLLLDADDDLLARVRRIACEVHPWAGAAADLVGRLRACGYAVDLREKRHDLAVVFARRA